MIVQELPDETLVYDRRRHQSSCLNRIASMVWHHCDGKTSVEEMATLLQGEFNTSEGEEAVWLALDQLQKAHLLQGRVALPPGVDGYTRRQLLRKLALVGAAVMVPVVIKIIAPTAVQATHTTNCITPTDCAADPASFGGSECDPPTCDLFCCGPASPKVGQCKPNSNPC